MSGPVRGGDNWLRRQGTPNGDRDAFTRGFLGRPSKSAGKPRRYTSFTGAVFGHFLFLIGALIIFNAIFWGPMVDHPDGWGVIFGWGFGIFIGIVYGYARSEKEFERNHANDQTEDES